MLSRLIALTLAAAPVASSHAETLTAETAQMKEQAEAALENAVGIDRDVYVANFKKLSLGEKAKVLGEVTRGTAELEKELAEQLKSVRSGEITTASDPRILVPANKIKAGLFGMAFFATSIYGANRAMHSRWFWAQSFEERSVTKVGLRGMKYLSVVSFLGSVALAVQGTALASDRVALTPDEGQRLLEQIRNTRIKLDVMKAKYLALEAALAQ